ncbi:MAG: hypothetical protein B6U95_00315 [Thermofilum sp. ex4484_82]|nr:MAG: hypothetical protein B6U95_00315 [Thermofilum sp. ex4484_82]OYT40058.1 MAG: hypothetical protein B6U96_00315 [Archaeoglobales archaeon ex4484_92]
MVKKSEEFYVSEAVYKIVVYSLSGLRERNLDFWVRTTIERDKTCVLFGHLINSTNGFVFRETLEVEFKRVGEQKSTKVNGIKILIRYNHTYSLGSHRDRVLLAFIISTKEKQIMLGDIVLIESETTLSVNSVYKAFLWIEGVLVLVYTVTATSRSISTLEEALERIFNKRMRLFGAVMRILIPIIVIFIFFVIRGILEVIIQNVAKIIQKTPS